jgi:soluble lytic murein transglycosylase-like protein
LRFENEADLDVRATSGRPLSSAELERAYQFKNELRRIAEANPAKAEGMLQGNEAKHLLDEADMNEARGMIAEAYLSSARVRRVAADTGVGIDQPAAEFEAGLADWRRNRFGEARKHFETAAMAHNATPGQAAAAAFWAARTQLRTRHPELVNYWLGIAAQHPYAFYGLLARRTLGVDSYFNFEIGAFTDGDARTLMGVASGRRALALLQVGETQRAEAELRGMAARGEAGLMQALEALADRANLPALAFQLAAYLSQSDGRNHDRSLFPVPRWTPRGGFTVDRALIFALMRQESQFLSNVRSRSGAAGVMQLMPATARSMASRLNLSVHDRQSLSDPELSLALAQEYISVLLSTDKIGNNLVLLAAAYNSGPGPIPRWLADEDVRKDPLLFLESIPSRETRGYTERVLANYWIYRKRLGQPTPDLDALAGGKWPTYTALDPPSGQGGSYAAN